MSQITVEPESCGCPMKSVMQRATFLHMTRESMQRCAVSRISLHGKLCLPSQGNQSPAEQTEWDMSRIRTSVAVQLQDQAEWLLHLSLWRRCFGHWRSSQYPGLPLPRYIVHRVFWQPNSEWPIYPLQWTRQTAAGVARSWANFIPGNLAHGGAG
jgi:hypothetical protein